MTIKWCGIPDWMEYEASENGDIRRVAGGQGSRRGRILKPWVNKQTGYLQVSLWRNNRRKTMTVHRLIAMAFHGRPPSQKQVVAHNDGSRRNNHWTNLRWPTQRENAADTLIHGTHNQGTRNGQAKMDEICIRAIRRMEEMKIPRTVSADGFGICRQTIDAIVSRRRWRHVA